jgi:hypothetical protein
MKILQVGIYSIKILTNGSAPRCSPNTQFHDPDPYVKTGRRQRWGNILVGQQTYPSKVEGVDFTALVLSHTIWDTPHEDKLAFCTYKATTSRDSRWAAMNGWQSVPCIVVCVKHRNRVPRRHLPAGGAGYNKFLLLSMASIPTAVVSTSQKLLHIIISGRYGTFFIFLLLSCWLIGGELVDHKKACGVTKSSSKVDIVCGSFKNGSPAFGD